ncbi:protein CHLOROPLAST IMPORT APPARATUS 2-like [Bidens hawaiensis]|uniref:protein CHLOROPLAST IMPORT APPARATUS 2-like n=1 Tax=Bidens hawaiensis TaxID=980011 RepID=UPI00404B3260
MSSSILTGATGRAYGFDIENVIKSPSMTSSRTSHSSSPSSTISESSNSPITISNRKPRTPRKRPNQTYNEAAVLLSIACPKVFSTKNLTNNNSTLSKCTAQNRLPFNGLQNGNPFCDPPPELLFPFPVVENSTRNPVSTKPGLAFGSKNAGCHRVPNGIEFRSHDSDSNSINSMEFDTESMLDEEIEEGIDGIMGVSSNNPSSNDNDSCFDSNTCYGYPMGLGFGGNLEFNFGFGMKNGIKALKNNNNWWNIPAVTVVDVSPVPVKVKNIPVEKKKKRVEELMRRPELELGNGNQGEGYFGQENNNNKLLKLNYDDVLSAWSDKGSPLPEEVSGSESADGDIHTRLAQIDLFSENGGLREASVMRYKEKKRTRLFSKKIGYQVRKVNADRRPRSKGRFVRRPSSEDT